MDPSIMKLLEDDEDESMHSGADVEAFTAALNRDIEGDPSTATQPSEPNAVGVLSQENISTSTQLPGQWQSSSQDENLVRQNQQNEQSDSQSPGQHSSQLDRIEQGSGAKDQNQHIGSPPERDQQPLQQEQSHSDNQQLQTETNPLQFAENDQVKIPEQNPVQGRKLDSPQHSEGQRQHTMEPLNRQVATAANDTNNSMRQTRASPSIPFHMLIPILRPHLDKDRSMQLQSVFTKLRSNEISKEDFIRVIRNIAGDQMLRQAAHKVQLQLQSQAAQSGQTNSNQYSLQAQTASQQLSSLVSQQFTEPQAFPSLHSMTLPNHKGHKSAARQPHIPVSSVQMQTDTSFPTLENSSQKSQSENKPDGKGMHGAQMYSTNMNVVNSERQTPMGSLQAVNKQQHAQLPQTSCSMYGSTAGKFHAHAYPRPSVSSAATSFKPEAQNSQMRQALQTQGTGSTHAGTTQPTNIINVSKYELQNAANETKRPHSASLTSLPASQKNPVAWQPLANKEHAFPSLAYVKQEVVDNAVESSQKFQFTAPEGPSFGSANMEPGNPTPGSLKDDRLEKQSSRMGFSTSMSMTCKNQTSGAVGIQTDTAIQNQMHSQISSATSLLAGASTKTPPKKPSIGQKKPLETLGTSPPPSSKKQKTSGAFLDQSIEQLNDVTAVSGVNLREEEEQLLSAHKEESQASEATRRVVQEEEERLILQKGPLQKKLTDIMSKCGLESIGSDVERCLSMSVEERLRGLISHMIRLSKQRVDIEKTRHQFVFTSDVRRQILAMNRKAKEEWDKKQADEAEKLRKLNDSEGNTGSEAEKDKDEGRTKTMKVNKEEDDKMRTTAANVAARAAVGGDDMLSKWQLMAEQARQKRDGLDEASGSQPGKTINRKAMPSFGRSLKEQQEAEKRGSSASSVNGGMRKSRNTATMPHPNITCNISIKDVIAVLEREPQMSKSALIYRLYEKTGGDSAADLSLSMAPNP